MKSIGILFAQNKKIEDACIIFNKILNINPQDIDSLINMGIAYYELNKFDQALNYLNQAKDLNKREDEVCFILGLIFVLYF